MIHMVSLDTSLLTGVKSSSLQFSFIDLFRIVFFSHDQEYIEDTSYSRDYNTKKQLEKVVFIFDRRFFMFACKRSCSGSVQVLQSFSYHRVSLN